MNWFQKLFCIHQWKKVYSHASLSMIDQSGIIELGEECIKCQISRGRVIVRDIYGRVEK